MKEERLKVMQMKIRRNAKDGQKVCKGRAEGMQRKARRHTKNDRRHAKE